MYVLQQPKIERDSVLFTNTSTHFYIGLTIVTQFLLIFCHITSNIKKNNCEKKIIHIGAFDTIIQ